MSEGDPTSASVPWWMRPRLRLIGLFCGFQAAIVYFISMVVIAISFGGDDHLLLTLGSVVFVAVFFALQLLFLRPIRRPILARRGVPIVLSLAVGGLLAAGLAVAAFCAVTQLVEVYAGRVGMPGWAPLGVLVGAWVIATPLLVAFSRGRRREDWLHRVASGLFLGTIIEAAAIIPLDALVRRREDCVCGTGTFFALAICCVIGLFLLGPAVVLPLISGRRRRWHGGRCDVCGYDMRGRRGAEVCPECGAGWREAGELG